MSALLKLIEYGYCISLSGDDIKFKYRKNNPPEIYKVQPYLQKIKTNKEYYVNLLKLTQKIQLNQETEALRYEYKNLNKNRIEIGNGLSKILQGIYKGENIYDLFLELIYIVSTALGETVTYETAKKNLTNIYGVSLNHARRTLGE